MNENSQALCGHPVPLEKNTQTMHFHTPTKGSVKYHIAKPRRGSALDIYVPAELASNLSLDTKTSPKWRGFILKTELTLDDTQERQG